MVKDQNERLTLGKRSAALTGGYGVRFC